MAISRRLTVPLAYKAAGAVPKVLYLGHDADEARKALEAVRDKGFSEVRICRDIDALWTFRIKADLVPALGV